MTIKLSSIEIITCLRGMLELLTSQIEQAALPETVTVSELRRALQISLAAALRLREETLAPESNERPPDPEAEAHESFY